AQTRRVRRAEGRQRRHRQGRWLIPPAEAARVGDLARDQDRLAEHARPDRRAGRLGLTMRVAPDVVPQAGRPEAVATALAEALALRDKQREASDALAAAQAAREQAQQADVVAAAERVRQGTSTGAVPAVVTKAKQAVELAKRDLAALRLAVEGAENDLADVMREHADAWLAALDASAEDSRQHGLAAVAAVADAAGRVG